MKKNTKKSSLPFDQSFEFSFAEKKRILKTRAKSLAREPGQDETAGEHIEVVEFLLAHETYAIEMVYIREVYPLKELTPIPCTPLFVLGVINVRGEILSVIDIKKFFDLPEKGFTELNKVIILRASDMKFGILVDSILGVRSIPLKDIQPPLPTMKNIQAEYVRGITGGGIIVLDARKILLDEKIVVHEKLA